MKSFAAGHGACASPPHCLPNRSRYRVGGLMDIRAAHIARTRRATLQGSASAGLFLCTGLREPCPTMKLAWRAALLPPHTSPAAHEKGAAETAPKGGQEECSNERAHPE